MEETNLGHYRSHMVHHIRLFVCTQVTKRLYIRNFIVVERNFLRLACLLVKSVNDLKILDVRSARVRVIKKITPHQSSKNNINSAPISYH